MRTVPGHLRLAEAVTRINEIHGTSLDYQRAWRCATAGLVPAKRVGGRLYIAEADLPVLAERLGLTPTAQPSAAA